MLSNAIFSIVVVALSLISDNLLAQHPVRKELAFGWHLGSSVDPMTDEKLTYVFKRGVGGDGTTVNGLLAVGCWERSGVQIVWHFDRFMPSNSTLRLRFDKEVAQDSPSFQVGKNNKNVLLKDVPEVLEKLKASNILRLEIRDYQGRAFLHTFDLLGFSKAHIELKAVSRCT